MKIEILSNPFRVPTENFILLKQESESYRFKARLVSCPYADRMFIFKDKHSKNDVWAYCERNDFYGNPEISQVVHRFGAPINSPSANHLTESELWQAFRPQAAIAREAKNVIMSENRAKATKMMNRQEARRDYAKHFKKNLDTEMFGHQLEKGQFQFDPLGET